MKQQQQEEEEKLSRSKSFSHESAQILSREEIAESRNSLKQNICVQLLQKGFHRSFSELFSLLQIDSERRAALEPGSRLRLQSPLEEQKEKLEMMKLHLTHAEQAERTGSWSLVCEHRLVLARFFSAPEDQWLSVHFYHSCADGEQGGRSGPATEARACLAELYLQQGQLQQAKRHAALCLQQAQDGGWTDAAGRPLTLRAQQTLCRIYDRLADAPLDAGHHKEALELLHRGYKISTECDDKQMEAATAYRLGLTYQSTGDHSTAKKFFNTCMKMYDELQDADGLGKAYKATAKSMQSEGDMDETVRCLEKFVDITRSGGLRRNLADACLCLGNIYFTAGQFSRASDFFLQGYEVACDVGDMSLLHKAQTLMGIARTHSQIKK